MKKLGFAAVVAASMLTVGCATHNMSQPTSPIQSQVSIPLEADVSVGKDITGESSATVLFGFINIGGDTKFADGVAYSGGMGGGAAKAIPLLGGVDPVGPTKAAAAYKAVTAANADIIIAPRYEVDVQDYFIVKMVNVNVKGKAGTIKNIRNK